MPKAPAPSPVPAAIEAVASVAAAVVGVLPDAAERRANRIARLSREIAKLEVHPDPTFPKRAARLAGMKAELEALKAG